MKLFTVMHRYVRPFVACTLSLSLVACASTGAKNPQDPYEGFNRAMFSVNENLDKVVKPVAQAYDTAAPLPVRVGISGFFGNLQDSTIGLNNFLQGKPSDGANDWARLLINSTLGIFGLFDVASELGLEKHDEDFGQTLAKWGVPDGGYLFLPILGPRTVRDAGAWVVEQKLDPVGQIKDIPVRNSARVVRLVNTRAELLPLEPVIEQAVINGDKYGYIRNSYLQRRRSLIHDGNPPPLPENDATNNANDAAASSSISSGTN